MKNELINGKIPEGIPCPFESECSTHLEGKCNRPLSEPEFSCGFARAFDLINNTGE